jgi:integrase
VVVAAVYVAARTSRGAPARERGGSDDDPHDHHASPHDLRHRRLTLWHQSGVPARELAERAGHSKPSMSLDVYTHVMPVAEVADERFLSLLADEGR